MEKCKHCTKYLDEGRCLNPKCPPRVRRNKQLEHNKSMTLRFIGERVKKQTFSRSASQGMINPAVIEITVRVTGGPETVAEFIQKLASVLKPESKPIAPIYDNTSGSTIDIVNTRTFEMSTSKKRRHYNTVRVPKPDPFELVKQGCVVRGPYTRGSKAKPRGSEIYLVDKKKGWKAGVTKYIVNKDVDEATAKKLVELAGINKTKGKQGPKGPRKEKPPLQQNGCFLCMNQDVQVGSCKSLKSLHCADCCTKLKHRVD